MVSQPFWHQDICRSPIHVVKDKTCFDLTRPSPRIIWHCPTLLNFPMEGAKNSSNLDVVIWHRGCLTTKLYWYPQSCGAPVALMAYDVTFNMQEIEKPSVLKAWLGLKAGGLGLPGSGLHIFWARPGWLGFSQALAFTSIIFQMLWCNVDNQCNYSSSSQTNIQNFIILTVISITY